MQLTFNSECTTRLLTLCIAFVVGRGDDGSPSSVLSGLIPCHLPQQQRVALNKGGGSSSSALSTCAIIATAVGVVVVLVLVMCGVSMCWVLYRSSKQSEYVAGDDKDAPPTSIRAGQEDDIPK